MKQLKEKISQRRTFAIIAHPDAGKTTLTEKLLLFGGAINLAGAVKAKGQRRRARSDWMNVEKERGISVASSVMTYDYAGCTFNLLDTPGHEDFSEDTYRTLTAVDSAVMVLDCAKGIESQTLKLFEVCRLRDMPIITFINKLDRDGQDPFDLLDEIEQRLALDVVPLSWPIGMGRHFLGCYDLLNDKLVLTARNSANKDSPEFSCNGLDDPKLEGLLPADALKKLRDDVDMVRGLCPDFDSELFLNGSLTPVWFGSAVNNFGVKELLAGLAELAPPPSFKSTTERSVLPTESAVTGFVFKIQANMDPKHRDRIAFFRLSSGHFKKGQKLLHVRTKKMVSIHNPILFLAQDRQMAEEAWPGDIIGIPNHGNLRIGDTLTEGEKFHFSGIPSFAPELLQTVRPSDPMKAKHLSHALQQLAEEGAASVFRSRVGSEWTIGVVGVLQFEVMADRIRTEYGIPVHFEQTSLYTARWVNSEDQTILKSFLKSNMASIADDHDGDPVFMARNAWHINKAEEDWPKINFAQKKEQSF